MTPDVEQPKMFKECLNSVVTEKKVIYQMTSSTGSKDRGVDKHCRVGK